MINNVFLLGKLVQDASIKTSMKGNRRLQFTLLVKEDENEVYVNCFYLRPNMDFMADLLKKGSLVAVFGKLAFNKNRFFDNHTVLINHMVISKGNRNQFSEKEIDVENWDEKEDWDEEIKNRKGDYSLSDYIEDSKNSVILKSDNYDEEDGDERERVRER